MKFRFYITDLNQGEVFGTNSNETANDFASCEDYVVVDSENSEWIVSDLSRHSINEK